MIQLKPDNVSPARYSAVMGLLFACTAALNVMESIVSAALPAGMRIGLGNIVIMAVILAVNLPSAALLVILKAVFVFLTRGFTAGLLSLTGGFLAFLVTAVLFQRTNASFILISTLGSLSHSAGQLLTSRLLLGTDAIFAYAPILFAGSAAAGICTGIVLKAVFPQIERILQHSDAASSTNREDYQE
ncbi:MAG: Gx transporter family protein [Clostridia bacterium]|nr:Gx transporter family protein [Clostridia bacterium]MBQ8369239.1 Gx transporter family protein [Clostridia bacterium]MBQ8513558.1 Gx transporter family protein [Clostridia bacterium]